MIRKFFVVFICAIVIVPLYSKNKYTILGEKAYATASYERAIEYFQKALDAGETRGEPYFFIGNILELQRKYSESANYFMNSVERPLKKDYKKAALWKLILYFDRVENYERTLQYITRIYDIGVHHKRLKKLEERAKANLTPELIEARKLVQAATDMEETINIRENLQTRDDEYWQQNAETLKKIIEYYQNAIRLNSAYKSNYKLIAFYAEKIREFHLARNLYHAWIDNDHDYLATYRLGVLEKKLNNYEKAIGYFEAIVNNSSLNKKENKLKLFVLINLAQANYALRRFDRAGDYSYAAMKLKWTFKKNKLATRLPILLFCNARILWAGPEYTREKRWAKQKNVYCRKLIEKYKADRFRKEEKRLFHLLKAKLAKESLLKSKKNSFSFLTIMTSNVRVAYLVNERAISSEVHWLTSEMGDVVRTLFYYKKYKELYAFVTTYKDLLKLRKQYANWKAASSFYLGKYSEAKETYLEIEERNLIQEKNLLGSIAQLNEWQDFQVELKSFARLNLELMKELKLFLRQNDMFAALREKPDFNTALDGI